MVSRRSIVVGYAGQDGTLLINDLKSRGDEIIGIGRSSCIFPERLSLNIIIDITNAQAVNEVIRLFRPDEIYYLAACHVSSEATLVHRPLQEQFNAAQAIHVTGLVNCLSAIVDESPNTRLFYASSSLVFSGENGERQDEKTPLSPQEFYGVTKAQGMWLCSEFRRKHKVFASTGILYNHESHLRKSSFLSAKIIRSAVRISRGSNEKLEIGNLAGRIDWGYAKDYVLAYQKILEADSSDDYIVATGIAHTVKEFIDIVFSYFDINQENYIVENNNLLTRRPPIKIGDATKLHSSTGWAPSMNYQEFVLQLIKDHLQAGISI